MWNDAVVTDTGMTVMSQWAGGGTLDITGAKLGGNVVPAVQLTQQITVSGYKGTADIIRFKDIEGGVQFTIRISQLDTAAVIKQIGIFGRLNGGDEKLIAIYQDNDGISVPGSEMLEFAYDFNATIATDKGSNINVNVDPMQFVTKAELVESIDSIKSDIANDRGTDEPWSESKSYAVGDYVVHSNTLWRCALANRGQTPSEGTYWTKVSLKNLSNDIINGVDKASRYYPRIKQYYGVSIFGGRIECINDGGGAVFYFPLGAKTLHFKSTGGSGQVGRCSIDASLPSIITTGTGRETFTAFSAGEHTYQLGGYDGTFFIGRADGNNHVYIYDVYISEFY